MKSDLLYWDDTEIEGIKIPDQNYVLDGYNLG